MDSEVSFSTNFMLKIPSTCPKIPSDWLKYELQIMRESVDQIRVFDINKTEIDVQNFAKNYEKMSCGIWGTQTERSSYSGEENKRLVNLVPDFKKGQYSNSFFDSEIIEQRGRAYDHIIYLNILEREDNENSGIFDSDHERDNLIDIYLHRRFVREDLTEVDVIVEMLLRRPFIEKFSNYPLRLKWKNQAQTQIQPPPQVQEPRQAVQPEQLQPQQIQIEQVKPQIQIQESPQIKPQIQLEAGLQEL